MRQTILNSLKPLPTANISLPQRAGDFSSIVEALDYASQGQTGLSFFSSTGQLVQTLRYRDLRTKAIAMSGKLRALGLETGDTVAIIGETCPEFLEIFYGCQYAGLLPCPLPHSIFLGGRNAFVERIAALVSAATAKLLCIPDSLMNLAKLWRSAGVRVISFSELHYVTCEEYLAPLGPDALAYIQFSSGSTADPKGVIISQRAVRSNVRGILVDCINIGTNDRAFSWLPFYHDMGLVGFSIAPLFAQTSVDYISPNTFARRPVLWLRLMTENRSTITFSPVFGYRLAALRLKSCDEGIDLSALRIAGIGGDMIDANQLDLFAKATGEAKFNPQAFTPCYGMAESALLITFNRGLTVTSCDRAVLEKDGRVTARANGASSNFAVCGTALRHHEFAVTDSEGRQLPEGWVGHIHIRGPSMFSGYRNGSDSFMVSPMDFFDTGDMGFRLNGNLVVTGRHKEMMIVNGRNIWPQDIERIVMSLPECASSSVAAIAAPRTGAEETVVILVERIAEETKAETSLISRIQSAVSSGIGLAARVELVAPGSLPYTSSGKLMRSKITHDYGKARTPI